MSKKNFKKIFEPNLNQLIEHLDLALKETSLEENLKLAKYLFKVCNSSLGLKSTQAPFNAHKDLMKRYIRETFSLQDQFILEFENSNWSSFETYQPALRFLIEEAENLPPMDADGSVDPFFKIFFQNSKLKPYISSHIENNPNPVWNQMVVIGIGPEMIHSNHEIICEVWDKDPTNIYEIVKDFRGVRKLRDVWCAIKDFSEWLVYLFFKINIDDKIGRISIFFNDIPATDVKLCKILKDSNGLSNGRLKLIVGWGSYFSNFDQKTQKLQALTNHFKIIKHCLLWHCQDLLENSNGAEILDSLNFHNFFYISGLSLINQHRIQNNMSHFENDIIFTCVVTEILYLELEKKQSHLRPILATLLTNHDIIFSNLNWHSDKYINCLNQFHLQTFTKLFQTYLQKFDQFLNIVITGDQSSSTFQEFLQILKLFSKQDKKYPESKFREKVNSKLSFFIISYIEKHFENVNLWSKLGTELEDFEERLSKYWSQGTFSILENKGRATIKSMFESKVKAKIFHIINEYKLKPEANEKELRNAYQFVQKLDTIIGGYFIQKCDTKSATCIVHRTDFPQASPIVVVKSEPKKKLGKFFGGIIYNINKSNVSLFNWSNQPIDKKLMISLPPTSVEKLQKEALKLKADLVHDLKIEELHLGDNFGFNPKIRGMNLSDVFSREVLQLWLKAIFSKCKTSISNAISKEFEIISKPEYIDNSLIIQKFFYDIIGNTIFFFTNLGLWDFQFFEETLTYLLNVVKNFSSSLTSLGLTEVNKKKVDAQTVLIKMINDLTLLKEKFLRKDLIEILTDYQAQDVWQAVYNYLSKEKIEFKSRSYLLESFTLQRKESIKKSKLSSFNQEAIFTCLAIDETCDELSKFEDSLIDEIGGRLLNVCLNDLKIFVEASIKIDLRTNLELIVNKFDKKLTECFNLIHGSQSKLNLLIYLKHNIILNVDKFFNFLSQIFNKENHTKKLQRRLTRIQIYKLSMISEKLMECVLKHFNKLSIPKYFHPVSDRALFDYEFKIDVDLVEDYK